MAQWFIRYILVRTHLPTAGVKLQIATHVDTFPNLAEVSKDQYNES